MGVGDGVGLWSRPRSRSSSACAEFNSKNVVLPTSSRNSRLYARLKTGRRDEYVQKHCDLQDKKHENTVLSPLMIHTDYNMCKFTHKVSLIWPELQVPVLISKKV